VDRFTDTPPKASPATAPQITCPGDVLTNAAGGVCLLPAIPFAASASGFPAPAISYKLGASTITSLTVFPLGSNIVTCAATNTTGANSCSFPVTVLAGLAPSLNLAWSLTNIVVSWPSNSSCYKLQIASALSSSNWNNQPGPLATNGGTVLATSIVSNTNRFFRLIH
jgi:hypothetical protein